MDTTAHSTESKTVVQLLAEIQSFFAILANTERLSLSETDESDVLCLQDATHIGGQGLDLVQELRNQLDVGNELIASVQASAADADPLAELMQLPLDRVVIVHVCSGHSFTGALAESPDNQVILFEPMPKGASRYHPVPVSNIIGWTDMRGEDTEPLFLCNRQYLTKRQILDKEKSSRL
ncbi:hypothetical protein [Microvirga guangxiensis]|uniref:Uncharacterized protein n=1 Tax=Microvirga guangxiensis TaxID=549386 RepID=A0A1G5KI66_9HYPH|nr:hypothetical protein [Microvirga guangxiensis]SCY99951.1 hypothetical protein SAMN02927923_03313 [Microvirga guangxiensis]